MEVIKEQFNIGKNNKLKKKSKELLYKCVFCGYPTDELYHIYSPTVQKLTSCKNCHQIADPLIEFDNLYIIINLILLSSQAQRHVLNNTSCRNLYKIIMIITIVESYFLWNELQTKKKSGFTESNLAKDPLFMEKGFYLSSLQIILANLTFFAIVLFISAFSIKENVIRTKNLAVDLLHGYMLASTAKFFFLPIIIWSENISEINRVIHLTLVICYFLISLIYIHSNVTGTSRKISLAIVLLAFIINKYIWFNFNFTGIT